MDILSEIIAHKRTEVELQKQSVSPEQLREQVQKLMGSSSVPRHSMRQALASRLRESLPSSTRRSPSKGGYMRPPKPKKYPQHTKPPVPPHSLYLRMKNSLAARCETSAQRVRWLTSQFCEKTSLSTNTSCCKHVSLVRMPYY
mgnify:CR=1 FL=1